MPWLAGTAFIHSVAVMEKRDALKVWTIFLAILVFSFSLLGTFLVRSGVLTIVHAFASDPRRGVFILAILAAFIAGSLALFAWRAPMLKQGGLFAPISREGALVLNNLLLTTACATVFFGTLYPLALEQVTGEKITVGAPFFNLTAGVLMLAVGLRHAVRLLARLEARRSARRRCSGSRSPSPAASSSSSRCVAFLRGGPVLAPIAAALARLRHARHADPRSSRAPGGAARRSASCCRASPACRCRSGAARSPISASASTLLGLAATGFGAETIATMQGRRAADGRPLPDHARFARRPRRPQLPRDGGGDDDPQGRRRRRHGRAGAPAVRDAADGDDPGRHRHACTSARSIRRSATPTTRGAVAARLYWKPLVTLIWLGAAAMALGGALSLADRRLRFGARRRRVRPPRAARGRAEAMARLRALLAFGFLLIAAAAGAVQPDEMMKDPALEARARTLVGRAALPRLPEPVDRRFRRAARRRHPPADPRAHRQGREQRLRCARSSSRATAISSC